MHCTSQLSMQTYLLLPYPLLVLQSGPNLRFWLLRPITALATLLAGHRRCSHGLSVAAERAEGQRGQDCYVPGGLPKHCASAHREQVGHCYDAFIRTASPLRQCSPGLQATARLPAITPGSRVALTQWCPSGPARATHVALQAVLFRAAGHCQRRSRHKVRLLHCRPGRRRGDHDCRRHVLEGQRQPCRGGLCRGC